MELIIDQRRTTTASSESIRYVAKSRGEKLTVIVRGQAVAIDLSARQGEEIKTSRHPLRSDLSWLHHSIEEDVLPSSSKYGVSQNRRELDHCGDLQRCRREGEDERRGQVTVGKGKRKKEGRKILGYFRARSLR
ncbi:hypothetical protein L484_027702 [Morus notabilis]|uniref:Uncharacterized protein n=1 Tax=Morus notabilis TaxID=981085 RepID=W9RN31_9ROSA|nr:hypothetical protein L484_027702 [Morus notabilis]